MIPNLPSNNKTSSPLHLQVHTIHPSRLHTHTHVTYNKHPHHAYPSEQRSSPQKMTIPLITGLHNPTHPSHRQTIRYL
ncbi:hypothetical protein P280DRAFT_260519 [Massarina eburnea CBS 473.64]|uniref:Uncharacterized protein n=1 Tax=Massarina eburnea CBS 473.64 TaxID=1395130 RepID=A0A6A6RJW3_9PLEO|nr:hypothetical protein P280DRAFT_260519 [Massarina eburnea CBS 473.64]